MKKDDYVLVLDGYNKQGSIGKVVKIGSTIRVAFGKQVCTFTKEKSLKVVIKEDYPELFI